MRIHAKTLSVVLAAAALMADFSAADLLVAHAGGPYESGSVNGSDDNIFGDHKKSLNFIEQKKKKKEKELRDLDEQVQELNQGITSIAAELFKLGQQIADREREIESTKKKLDDKIEALKISIRFIEVTEEPDFPGAKLFFRIVSNSKENDEVGDDSNQLESNLAHNIKIIEGHKLEIQENVKKLGGMSKEAEYKKQEMQKRKDKLKEIEVNSAHELKQLEEEQKKIDSEQAAREKEKNSKPNEEVRKVCKTQKEDNHSSSGDSKRPPHRSIALRGSGSLGQPCRPIKILQHFGGRHKGIDLAGKPGDELYAVFDGEVVSVNDTDPWGSGWGFNVVIRRRGGGMEVRYAHLNKVSVGVGQTVYQGQVIGTMGRTGRATCVHLHLECTISGNHVNPGEHLHIGP
ncbi:MAG: peptidoglycan DD-metalloendopeptidase family protein [Oscillospiraceae bacterium]|jgi:murein DD-endopeptidase MepM/ murein hydrolase activator NlpD|nr:peptidoglycan DD-metalloendopeptidase family protein [Oscillospiraceae bacterium]